MDLIEIRNAVRCDNPEFENDHPMFEDDARRESSAFICDENGLKLLVPYDSGVCYMAVDLDTLLDFLWGEFDVPNWMRDRIYGLLSKARPARTRKLHKPRADGRSSCVMTPTKDRPVRHGDGCLWQRYECTVCGATEMNAIEVNGKPVDPYPEREVRT